MLTAISPDCDLRGLIGAMAEEAARQARRGNGQAALWLATDGAFMLDAAGMETAAFMLGRLGRDLFWKNYARKQNRLQDRARTGGNAPHKRKTINHPREIA